MRKIIELEHISKKFEEREVLSDINLSVNEGELVTIMGESGAGKTTLLNILAFFETPTAGKYLFKGIEVEGSYQRNKIRNYNMGFVFQSYNLIPKLTVYENIILPIYYSMASKTQKENYIKRIPYLLERFNIKKIEKSYVDHISGGEKQRVCLARALANDARLIISDEPTGNLDEKNAGIVLEEFKKMNEEGKTVIIVTHDKNVEKIAKKQYCLREGKLF